MQTATKKRKNNLMVRSASSDAGYFSADSVRRAAMMNLEFAEENTEYAFQTSRIAMRDERRDGTSLNEPINYIKRSGILIKTKRNRSVLRDRMSSGVYFGVARTLLRDGTMRDIIYDPVADRETFGPMVVLEIAATLHILKDTWGTDNTITYTDVRNKMLEIREEFPLQPSMDPTLREYLPEEDIKEWRTTLDRHAVVVRKHSIKTYMNEPERGVDRVVINRLK